MAKKETTLPKDTKSSLSKAKTENEKATKGSIKKVESYNNSNLGKEEKNFVVPKHIYTKPEDEAETIIFRSGGQEDIHYNGGMSDQFKKRVKKDISGEDGKQNKIFTDRAKFKNKLERATIEMQGNFPVGKDVAKVNKLYSEEYVRNLVNLVMEQIDGTGYIEETTENTKSTEDLTYFIKSFGFILSDGTISLSDFAKEINGIYSKENQQVAEAVNTINNFDDEYYIVKNGNKVNIKRKDGNSESVVNEDYVIKEDNESPFPEDIEYDSRNDFGETENDNTEFGDIYAFLTAFDEDGGNKLMTKLGIDESVTPIDETFLNKLQTDGSATDVILDTKFGDIYISAEMGNVISIKVSDDNDDYGQCSTYDFDTTSIAYCLCSALRDYLKDAESTFVNEPVTEAIDNNQNIQPILDSYFETLLWINEEQEEGLSDKTIYDFSEQAKQKSIKDINKFIAEINENETAKSELEELEKEELLGHNFALSRTGQGAGFFDYSFDELQRIANEFGDVNLFVNNDGKVEIEGGKLIEGKSFDKSKAEYGIDKKDFKQAQQDIKKNKKGVRQLSESELNGIQYWVLEDVSGDSYDKYSLITVDGDVFGFSENPSHPQGVGQFVGNIFDWNYKSVSYYIASMKNGGDREITIENLPEKAQVYVKSILGDVNEGKIVKTGVIKENDEVQSDGNWIGSDVDLEISLVEYGFVAKQKSERDYPDEWFVVYKSNGGYDYGYKRESELDSLIKGEGWMDEDDVNSLLSYVGISTVEEWLQESFINKLSDLLSYYGSDNVMGSSYTIIPEKEALEMIGITTNEDEVTESINEVDDFKSERNKLSDYNGRDLSVIRGEDGLLVFDFDSSGWLFDTNDLGEGAAICAGSKFIQNEELRKVQITEADKQNVDLSEALYWLSGGNTAWRLGQVYEDGNLDPNEDWESVKHLMVEYFGDELKTIIDSSNTLGELMDGLKEFKINEVQEEWSDFLLSNGIYFDESNDVTEESIVTDVNEAKQTNVETYGDWKIYQNKETNKWCAQNIKTDEQIEVKNYSDIKRQIDDKKLTEEINQSDIDKITTDAGEDNEVIIGKDETGKQTLTVKNKIETNESIKDLAHAKTFIPESYKTNGNVFSVTDGNTTFTFKWEKESFINECTLIGFEDKSVLKENKEKSLKLMNYKSPKTSLNDKAKLGEDKMLKTLLGKVNE